MSTVDEREISLAEPPEPAGPPPAAPSVGRLLLTLPRRFWRWLTSMRTALILLFLLALAAIPGSLIPQRNLNIDNVQKYFTQHPTLAPILDRLWVFNVFSAPWFAAIYLLLFVSLVGCLVPRLRRHVVAMVRIPPDAPRRLDRLPAHAEGLRLTGDPAAVTARLHALLKKRRFRVKVREQSDGGYTVSAEKGYLKETGNILFHLSLLTILIGVAFGSWYGYHADRVVVQGADQGFCNTLQQYDDYGLGARVNPASMEPFCLQLTSFTAKYLADGQPVVYSADVRYNLGTGPEKAKTVQVNTPLRLAKARVYLLGHGYAPVVRYTDKYGRSQTIVTPFLPTDTQETSNGVIEFPDANVPSTGRDPANKQQVAFSGIYLPTAPSDPSVGHSAFPAENNPALMLVAYRGDLGLDAGIPHSVYSLDQTQISAGRLVKVGAPMMLKPGQSATLDDGTTVQFLGTRPWVSMSVRYDPGELVVLAGAICLLIGLITMLAGKRRRVWFRIDPGTDPASGPTEPTGSDAPDPADPPDPADAPDPADRPDAPAGTDKTGPVHSAVAAGALARSEYSGFTAEFDDLLEHVRAEEGTP